MSSASSASSQEGQPAELLAELEAEAQRLDAAPAEEILAWAVDRFQGDLAVAASFQDPVLIDLAVAADPKIEVIFLDTGFHFPETLAYVERLRKHYDLNLTVTHPAIGPDEAPCGTEHCCELRKVAPLAKALEGRQGWVTGLKRVDAATRADAPVLGWDPARAMVKLNPMAAWSDEDVYEYMDRHDLPHHPLNYVGYVSIGCAPTTVPVPEGHHPREGRWAGMDKTECGLHL